MLQPNELDCAYNYAVGQWQIAEFRHRGSLPPTYYLRVATAVLRQFPVLYDTAAHLPKPVTGIVLAEVIAQKAYNDMVAPNSSTQTSDAVAHDVYSTPTPEHARPLR